MKKFFICFAALAMVLAGCKKNSETTPDEPALLGHQGDWYCYQAKADAQFKINAMMVISIDTTMHLDTTYVSPQRYQLTADNFLISGDKDTLATYVYDEKESQLVISTDRFLRNAGIDPSMAAMFGFPPSVTADFSYTAETAKGSMDYEADKDVKVSGIPVSYVLKIKGNMYFQRKK